MSDQQRVLKYGATKSDLITAGKSRWAARVQAAAATQPAKPSSAGSSAVAYQATGPLGYQQMWCGGPDAYKVWAALPEVQAAWHVKSHDPSGNMKWVTLFHARPTATAAGTHGCLNTPGKLQILGVVKPPSGLLRYQ